MIPPPPPPRSAPTSAVAVPPPPPPSLTPGGPRPSRRFGRGGWILLGLLFVALLGGFALAVGSFLRFDNDIDNFARADAPGRSTVTLDAGNFVVYAEYPGANCTGVRRASDGDTQGCEPVPAPRFDYRVSGANEATLAIARYRTSLNYELSGRSGRAIGTIEVPTAGQYTITATGDPVTIAIGPSVARGIVGLVLAVLIAGAALLALIGTGIVMGVRRASARR